MTVETIPSFLDRIQPLNPNVVRKRKKQPIKVIDNARWMVRSALGIWKGVVPVVLVGSARTLGTLNVHPKAQTMSPAVAAIAKPAVQSSMGRLFWLVRITARNANENPAMSALMKAL